MKALAVVVLVLALVAVLLAADGAGEQRPAADRLPPAQPLPPPGPDASARYRISGPRVDMSRPVTFFGSADAPRPKRLLVVGAALRDFLVHAGCPPDDAELWLMRAASPAVRQAAADVRPGVIVLYRRGAAGVQGGGPAAAALARATGLPLERAAPRDPLARSLATGGAQVVVVRAALDPIAVTQQAKALFALVGSRFGPRSTTPLLRRSGLRVLLPEGWSAGEEPGHAVIANIPRAPYLGGVCPLPQVRGSRVRIDIVAYDRPERLTAAFPLRPRSFGTLRNPRAHECFGRSRMVRWQERGRFFQAHVALGGRVDNRWMRDQARAVLDSLRLERPSGTAPGA